jgi:hypothetical protein
MSATQGPIELVTGADQTPSPRPATALVPAGPIDHVIEATQRPVLWLITGAISTLAVVVFLAGAPLLSAGLVGAGAAHCAISIGLCARAAAISARERWPFTIPLHPGVPVSEILSDEVRDGYRAILRTHEEIRLSLAATGHPHLALRTVYERCTAAAIASGRIASLANPMHRYLGRHDPDEIRGQIARLGGRVEDSREPATARVYRHAVVARRRQLETVTRIERMMDLIVARLEMAGSTLQLVAAIMVEQQVRDVEEVARAGESMGDELEALREDLELLQLAMAEVEWVEAEVLAEAA